MSTILQQLSVSFFLTLVLIVALSKLAPLIGLVDSPKGHKEHSGQIPLIGGVAIYLCLLFCAFVWSTSFSGSVGEHQETLWIFLAAGGVLVVLGVIDDRYHLSVFTRSVVEIFVALIILEGLNIRLSNLGNLLGSGVIRLSDWVAYPMNVILIFGIINAYNMLDGMDGLLSIISIITLLAFHLFTGIAPGLITIVIISSLVAFLISNLGLAPYIPKSFLGDAGSKFLGFLVVALILTATSSKIGEVKYITPVTAAYLVALPVFDMIFTIIRRVNERRSPIKSDKTHIHHLMKSLGLSRARSLWVVGSLGIAFPFLGLMLANSGASEYYQFYVLIGCFVLYCILMNQAWFIAGRIEQNKNLGKALR